MTPPKPEPTGPFTTAVTLKFSRHLSQSLILPSLPAIMLSLSAPQNLTQMIVAAFIIGMVIAKLIVTFLADHLRLRRTILILLPFLLVGSLLCLVPDIRLILLGRAMQGIGIGGASALAISIIKDTTPDNRYTRKLSQWAILVEWAPPTALILGGLIQQRLDWHYNFVIIAILSLGLIVLAITTLPKEEPHPEQHPVSTSTQKIRMILNGYKDPQFLAYSLMYSLIVSGQIVFYTVSPFYLIHTLGMSANDYGLALIPYFAALILGAAATGLMQKHFSSISIVRIALLLGFVGSLSILAFALGGQTSAWTLIAPMALYGLCHSMLGLQVEVKVSTFFSETPIANLGLLGLTLALVSAIVSVIAAHIPSNTATPIAIFLLALVSLSLMATLLLKPDPPEPSTV
ncbi:MAG: MFS transporter [Myxococcota bacterium]|nr:MFS transporter [Myxococcota bacterium]